MSQQLNPDEISSILKKQLAGFTSKVETSEVGTVLNVGDGIARVFGLANVMAGELVEFPGGIKGIALNLESSNVNAVESMVNMITLARQFDNQMKMLQTADNDAKAASSLLNING